MPGADAIDSRVLGALQGEPGQALRSTSDELRGNFMTLLVTQLKNQDPLNPMENAEMTSQLAQINTVGGIDALNDTLQGITSQIEAGHSLQAASLIGKEVLVPGERVLVGQEGDVTPFGIELTQAAERVELRILGMDGQLLRTQAVGPLGAGVETFVWDGKLENGEAVPPGAYRVAVSAWTAAGEALETGSLNYAVVRGVSTLPREGLRLDLGGVAEPVRLEDVRQIL